MKHRYQLRGDYEPFDRNRMRVEIASRLLPRWAEAQTLSGEFDAVKVVEAALNLADILIAENEKRWKEEE